MPRFSDAASIKQWAAWEEAHAASLPEKGGMVVRTRRISKAGIGDAQNAICGYRVVEADSTDAAARLFENRPHFTIFPDDSVDIMPLLTGPRD